MTSDFRGKNIAVFGLGKAGRAAVDFLINSGALVSVWDDSRENCSSFASEMVGKNVTIAPPDTYVWACMSYLVLSPGIPFTHPKPHIIVEMAQKVDCPIICDVELLYKANPTAKFIGITGTNGKSTTTALTQHIAQYVGLNSFMGGNIGTPASALPTDVENAVYILEMSSYQLDLLQETKFDIASLLNITPDHIDRHGDMERYIKVKKNIFDRQGDADFAIVSVDTAAPKMVYEDLLDVGAAKLLPISTKSAQEGGIFVADGVLYDNMFGAEKYKFGEIKSLKGEHNAQNIATAYASIRALGISGEKIISAIKTFNGLEHRLQYVCAANGIDFINDSKATNAVAASNALKTFEKDIYWILGGVEKEGGIAPLKKYFSRVKYAFLIGEAQGNFTKTLKSGKVDFDEYGNMKNAFEAAIDRAISDKVLGVVENPVILLSPACASFDQFKDFEERGRYFSELARGYKLEIEE